MDFNYIATECVPWVHPQTLAAIVRHESSFNPLSINVNWDANHVKGYRLARQPATKEEAVVTATDLISKGFNIDVGPGQVNSENMKRYRLSVEDAFDPCRNLAVAGSILFWNYQGALKTYANEQRALRAAISMYNTGSYTKGFANGYVQKVVSNAAKQVPAIVQY